MAGRAPPKRPQQQKPKRKRKRNSPGNPDPNAEVIALSPATLIATARFICLTCEKGFQREQNLRLHLRGHNIHSELRHREGEARRRVYVCPEPTCVHHNPARALGDITGIKKHYSRKHCEKKWECKKCSKKYALDSDLKAHLKTCNGQNFACDCGKCFTRKDTYEEHRASCDGLAAETANLPSSSTSVPDYTPDPTPPAAPLPAVPEEADVEPYIPQPPESPPYLPSVPSPPPGHNPMDDLPDDPNFLAATPFTLTQLLTSNYGDVFGPSPSSLVGFVQLQNNNNDDSNNDDNNNDDNDATQPPTIPSPPHLSLSHNPLLEANNKECSFSMETLMAYSNYLTSTAAEPVLSLSPSIGDHDYGMAMGYGAGCSKLVPTSGPDLSLNTNSGLEAAAEENKPVYYSSASMSATALLQKAAEMGVMTTSHGGNEASPAQTFFSHLFNSFRSTKESDLQVFGRQKEQGSFFPGSTSSYNPSNVLTTLTMTTPGAGAGDGGETHAGYMNAPSPPPPPPPSPSPPPPQVQMENFPWFPVGLQQPSMENFPWFGGNGASGITPPPPPSMENFPWFGGNGASGMPPPPTENLPVFTGTGAGGQPPAPPMMENFPFFAGNGAGGGMPPPIENFPMFGGNGAGSGGGGQPQEPPTMDNFPFLAGNGASGGLPPPTENFMLFGGNDAGNRAGGGMPPPSMMENFPLFGGNGAGGLPPKDMNCFNGGGAGGYGVNQMSSFKYPGF